jgi:hypothetical protein
MQQINSNMKWIRCSLRYFVSSTEENHETSVLMPKFGPRILSWVSVKQDRKSVHYITMFRPFRFYSEFKARLSGDDEIAIRKVLL